jgi:hypothetical protein
MNNGEQFPDTVALLVDGWAVRYAGCVQSPRWTDRGAAEAQLDLLQRGVRKPEPQKLKLSTFEQSLLGSKYRENNPKAPIVLDLPILCIINNKWRERIVTVYAHPINPEMVISIGVPFDPRREVVPCEETLVAWRREILEFEDNGRNMITRL